MAAAAKPVASPKSIEEAKARAIELCNQAYAPQPVPQPDGSELRLCWDGRVSRAWQLWEEAQRKGNNTLAQRLEEAANVLNGRALTAKAAAEKAASDYGALASIAGQRNDNVYPPACECEQCRRQQAQQAYFAAEMDLRIAVSSLLEPDDAKHMPALVALVDGAGEKGQRDLLWRTLKRIADAQRAYSEACKAFDQHPHWARAMYGEAR